MDIVICLAAKDYKIVKKVIRGCRLNLQSASDRVFIITDISNKLFFPNKWLESNNVTLVDENSLVEGLSFDSIKEMLQKHFCTETAQYPGWYLQQFLKMGFALSTYATAEYLIWDSDTIPLRSIQFKEGHRYMLTVKSEHHIPYFETMQNLLGFGRLNDRSFIAEHMPINVSVMKDLISVIAQSSIPGNWWFEKIINATSGRDEQAFSEFETYGNFLLKNYSEQIVQRPLNTMRTAGMLFGRGVTKSQLSLLAKMEYDTASFELRDIPAFPRNIANWIERIQLRLYRELGWVKK